MKFSFLSVVSKQLRHGRGELGLGGRRSMENREGCLLNPLMSGCALTSTDPSAWTGFSARLCSISSWEPELWSPCRLTGIYLITGLLLCKKGLVGCAWGMRSDSYAESINLVGRRQGTGGCVQVSEKVGHFLWHTTVRNKGGAPTCTEPWQRWSCRQTATWTLSVNTLSTAAWKGYRMRGLNGPPTQGPGSGEEYATSFSGKR